MPFYLLSVIINPVARNTGIPYWVTILLFACLVILAWVKVAYPRKIPLLVREVFTRELAFEEKSITSSSIALFVVFLCSSVLLITELMHNYGVKLRYSPLEEFGLVAAAVLAFYLLKTFALIIIGFIFEEQSNAWEYISEIYVFAHFLGVLLLPLMFINAYGNHINHKLFDEILAGFIILLFAYRTVKMFILMINKGLRMVYLFLYICAFEIIPLALFIRYAIMNL